MRVGRAIRYMSKALLLRTEEKNHIKVEGKGLQMSKYGSRYWLLHHWDSLQQKVNKTLKSGGGGWEVGKKSRGEERRGERRAGEGRKEKTAYSL